MERAMRAPAPLAVLATALFAASGVAAAPGGKLQTLPLGRYVCSLPGDAAGEAWQVIDGEDFVIVNASSYETDQGTGTYLLTGETVQFTRGPMKGARFLRVGHGTLRAIDAEGAPGRVRCVRGGSAR